MEQGSILLPALYWKSKLNNNNPISEQNSHHCHPSSSIAKDGMGSPVLLQLSLSTPAPPKRLIENVGPASSAIVCMCLLHHKRNIALNT